MKMFIVKVFATYSVLLFVLGEEPEIQVSITQGLDAILPCMINFNSYNPAQFKVIWTGRSDEYLSINESVIADHRKFRVSHPYPNEWNLQVLGVRSSDAGKYKCQVNSDPVQTKYVVLHVNVPPRISSPERAEVKEGELLLIHCNVTGIPPPNVTWYKDGKELMQYSGEVLMIEQTVRGDRGVYTCKAKNGIYPEDTEDITVDVFYLPSVHVHTSRIGQYRYKPAVLECLVVANPLETVTWYKNAKPLRDNWKYKSEDVSQSDGSVWHSLSIIYLDRTDFGDYVCMATNKVGSASAVISVLEMVTTTVMTTSSSQETPSTPKPDDKEITTALTYIVTSSPISTTSSKTINVPDKTDSPQNGGNTDNLVVVPKSSSNSSRVCHVILLFCILGAKVGL